MATITSRESLQSFRQELIQHVAEGLPVEAQLAEVERSLLRQIGKAVVSGEFAAAIGEGQPVTTCTTCRGTGHEHAVDRIRSRYVDIAVRCTDCDGRGRVAA